MENNFFEVKAACRGCHGGCMLILTIADGRAVKVRPDPEGPLNRGKACIKGMTIIEQMYHPDRLTHPMRRIGTRGNGKWEKISWDEAYDIIAEKIGALRKKHGPECIAITTGTGRHHLPLFWRFGNVLETPNATSSGALVCLGPRLNASMVTAGIFAGVDYFGDKKPGGILVWGSNPAISGPDGELQWFIKDAVSAGTPLVVVDPQPTELTKAAVCWLRLRPGTDGALALGILNVIISEKLYDEQFVENDTYGFDMLKDRVAEYSPKKVSEITWVPEEKIRQAARIIASLNPLGLEWGCAIEQTPNAFQTCRAILMIVALTGNWDIPGGFVESMEIASTPDPLFDRLSPEISAKCISGGFPFNDGTLSPKMFAHPYEVFDAMRTGKPYKIRGLFSNANNSLLSMPDSAHVRDGLKELEFFVYMDIFMTPTAEFADIVLPAALWPEIDSVYCMPEFGDYALLTMRKAVQVGECKSDEEFFIELCNKMGLDFGAQSTEEILNEVLHEMGKRRPELCGIDFEKMKELNYIVPEREYFKYKSRGFRTPTGKFELYSKAVERGGGDPLPYWEELPESPISRPELCEKYPLILTTGSRKQEYFISNGRQIQSLRSRAPFPLVSMHPDTAKRFEIKEGDWVWIETPKGKITQKAVFKKEMDTRVVNCEMGWWYPEAGAPGYGWDESNANILTIGDARRDPMLGAYQLRGLMCAISRNNSDEIERRYFESECGNPE